jgi:2-methylcitrate dehydratase PrpD
MTVEQIAAGLKGLTEWSAALDWADVPGAVRLRAALVMSDDLAAMVAARDEPELAAAQVGIMRSAGRAEATLFNARGERADRYSAATANGCAADWCELDGGYRRVICHAGIYALPAILAEAEAEGHSTQDVLRALVIGYETAARVARCFLFPNLVLHPHGSLAAIGAAAGTAAIRRLSATDAAAAISSAATMVLPGPYTHPINGSLVRNVWPGVAAWTGMRATDWALAGIRGLPSALHDVYVDAFGATAHPHELTDGLGSAYALTDGYHKVFACCQYGHATIEATMRLRDRADWRQVTGIHLDTHYKARVMDNTDPDTTIAGKFSIQHIAATAAVHGDGGAGAFSAAVLNKPEVAALRHKVTMAPYTPEPAWPNDRPSRVTWTLADGTTLSETVLSARGGPDLPFSPDEIRTKIAGIVTGPYPGMLPILDRILTLDSATLARPWADCVAEMVAK